LIIIGAILRFRGHLDAQETWTCRSIGVILMIGGVVGLCVAIGLAVMRRRDRGAIEVTEQRPLHRTADQLALLR